METPTEEMLAVTANANCQRYLKKTARTTTWTFLGGIIISLMMTVGALFRYLNTDLDQIASNRFFYFEMMLLPWWMVLSGALSVIQVYLYRRFAIQASKALRLSDSDGFNEAFPVLYRSSVLAVAMMVMSVLDIALSLSLEVGNYLTRHG